MQDDFHIEISPSSHETEAALQQIQLQESIDHTVPAFYEHENVQTDSIADQFPLNQRSTSQERDQSRRSAAERQRARRQSRRENEDTVSTPPCHRRRGNPSNPGHWWDNVAVLNTSKVQRNTLKWTRTCKHCGIKVLTNERTLLDPNSGITNKTKQVAVSCSYSHHLSVKVSDNRESKIKRKVWAEE
ncbi:uncharacterized protein ARMOST_03411 [Armillaria ostoyae]|uniref:Uncharacterized protein n=1 Tax=Armillaria ostoyae TaxID=47428 RepID=A0A284QUH8_ARMOS|nr:uncharacterized protein ARMOST_03411 [Armillaria ostoyae]